MWELNLCAGAFKCEATDPHVESEARRELVVHQYQARQAGREEAGREQGERSEHGKEQATRTEEGMREGERREGGRGKGRRRESQERTEKEKRG